MLINSIINHKHWLLLIAIEERPIREATLDNLKIDSYSQDSGFEPTTSKWQFLTASSYPSVVTIGFYFCICIVCCVLQSFISFLLFLWIWSTPVNLFILLFQSPQGFSKNCHKPFHILYYCLLLLIYQILFFFSCLAAFFVLNHVVSHVTVKLCCLYQFSFFKQRDDV